MTKCVKVLRASALIRACDWSMLFAFALACNTLTHFVMHTRRVLLPWRRHSFPEWLLAAHRYTLAAASSLARAWPLGVSSLFAHGVPVY